MVMPIITTDNSFFHTDYVMGGQIIEVDGKKYLEILLNTGEKTVFPLPKDIDEKLVITVVTSAIFSDDEIIDFEQIIQSVSEDGNQIKEELEKQKLISIILESSLGKIKNSKISDILKEASP